MCIIAGDFEKRILCTTMPLLLHLLLLLWKMRAQASELELRRIIQAEFGLTVSAPHFLFFSFFQAYCIYDTLSECVRVCVCVVLFNIPKCTLLPSLARSLACVRVQEREGGSKSLWTYTQGAK